MFVAIAIFAHQGLKSSHKKTGLNRTEFSPINAKGFKARTFYAVLMDCRALAIFIMMLFFEHIVVRVFS